MQVKQRKSRQTAYDNLAIMPSIVAHVRCTEPYAGIEHSRHSRSGSHITITENKRKEMTAEQRKEYCEIFDNLCRKAYGIKAQWFEKCKNNPAQLHIWASHWLSAYLNDHEFVKLIVSELEGKPEVLEALVNFDLI